MTMAKGIANGFPVGAPIATDEVANAFTGPSLSTFGGTPVAMAAAEATLDVMQRENIPQKSEERGRQLREALEAMKEKYPFIGEVRGMGLMQAVELVENRKTKEPAPKKAARFMEASKRQGILVGKGGLYGNVLRIAPPMLISKGEIADGIARLEKAFEEVKFHD
jgi:4-aminobutyrate aminotransferase-like enzyme